MGASEQTEWLGGARWAARPDIGPQPTWRGAAKAEETVKAPTATVSSEGGPVTAAKTPEPKFFEDGAPSFMDLLDIINPLQHIPVVSSIYRHLTGDEIGYIPRVAGGALFFGPIGAGVALANAMIDRTTGRDVGGHIIALLTKDAPATTMVAEAEKLPADVQSLASIETAAGLPAVPSAAVEPPKAVQAKITETAVPTTSGPIPIESLPPELRDALRQQRRADGFDAGAHKLAQRKAKEPTVSASTARRQWATDADAFAAAAPKKKKEGAAETEENEAKPSEPKPAVVGAVAPEGGWFSKTMLDALEKYQRTQNLTEAKETSALSVVN